MTQWLAWRTGVSPATARNIVTIAERIDELPECIVRFRRGELSLEQTSAIARRAPLRIDRQMSSIGTTMTVRQIQRLLAHYPFPEDDPAESETGEPRDATSEDDFGADEQDEADRHADAAAPTSGSPVRAPETVEDFCSMLWNDDGTFQIHVAADAETGLTRHSPTRSAINSCVTERSCRRGARTDSRCPSAGANTSSPIAPAGLSNTVTTPGAESLAARPATTSKSTTSSTGSRADRPIPGI
jgi:hypothetical protein